MLKFSNINPDELAKLRNMKAGSLDFQQLDLKGGGAPTDFTMPHASYTLGVDDILKQDQELKPEQTGVRVLEANQNNFQQIYDLNNTETGRQPHRYLDPPFLSQYEQAFKTLFNSSLKDKDYEVRNLKVPALHLDVLWLHSEAHEEQDKFMPVGALQGRVKNRFYDKAHFMELLKQMARSYEEGYSGQDSDLLGG